MDAQIVGNRFAIPASPVHEGAHGKLFRGTDLHDDSRPVAFKIFIPSGYLDDGVLQAAWSNELSAYQRLGDHPNLARIIDWGRLEDGAPYLVFEWLGRDLLAFLPELSLEGWDDFWPVAEGILGGLSALHSAGFVHRDVKPENILVPETGGYKLADFGTTRLAETASIGRTMALLGTIPYAPPERGTPGPLPAYDLYSFVVLTTVCLTGRVPGDIDGTLTAFESLDLPPDVHDLLATCLATDPDERPQSASELLAGLRQVQNAREARRGQAVELFLDIPEPALDAFRAVINRPITPQDVIEDVSAVAAFAFNPNPLQADHPDLQIAGQTLLLRAQEHRTRPGVLRVAWIVRPTANRLEEARAEWFRPKIILRVTVPTDAARAQSELSGLLEQVQFEDARRNSLAKSQEAFPVWRNTLRAKFALERQRGQNIQYGAFRREGSRVLFAVRDLPAIEMGEGRLVRRGPRGVLYGEVEGVVNGELTLFVTRGDAGQVPARGMLELDTEGSKSKLRREERALDRVSGGASTRPDLRHLLADPSLSRAPEPAVVEDFIQARLDPIKQDAVRASLGTRDFLLVQGPPGTGKTTFIAEIVSQELRRNPDSRILLTSQTHIALDNALLRIREITQDAVLLRIGRADRLAEDVEELAIREQMVKWGEVVSSDSKAFLKDYAAALGISTDTGDAKEVAEELSRRRSRARDIRSRLSLRQAERKALAEEVDRIASLATPILTAAEAVEKAAADAQTEVLVSAAQQFIEVGLRLAAQLESGGSLSARLLEMDRSLTEWREELETVRGQQRDLAEQLRTSLGLSIDVPVDDLVKRAEELSDSDPRVSNLSQIADDWRERLGRDREFEAVLIARAQVVAATCVGLTGVPGVEAIPFDLCIVDEASKATATEALVPLSVSRRWVLVGDEHQLPPFVDQALDDPALLSQFNLSPVEIKQTLFQVLSERLPDACQFALTHQHRMHPAIGQLISECFYGGELTSEQRSTSPVVLSAMAAPVLWLDTSGRQDRRETPSGTTFKNQGEARVIADLLDRLNWVAKQKKTELQVVVLTGYDAQRREVLERLAYSHRQQLRMRVATVDSYQGQEADIAIFSVTRSNQDGVLGFLSHRERINVALSRARDGLVIVGDAIFADSAAHSSNPLREVLRYVRGHPGDCAVEVVGK